MPTSLVHLSTPPSPVGAGDPAVRRYSRARRNLLPRDDRVMVVAGAWALERLLDSDAEVETALWCGGGPADDVLPDEPVVSQVLARARRAVRISGRTLARIHPGLTAPALVAVVRLPSWEPADVLTEGP